MNGKKIINRAKQKINEYTVSQKSREESAEIHTPPKLINKMLDQIPDEKFKDPEGTFLDPCAGCGNFGVHIAERLVSNGISYQHAMENQIFMVEIQPENCVMIENFLNPIRELNLNLKCCDALELDIEHMELEDWKSEKFRCDYSNADKFFKRTPTGEEISCLDEIRNLTDNQQIIHQFERGYGGE